MSRSVLVVVPTLGRRPELLEQCLASIAAQGVPGLDLVIVAPPGQDHVAALAAGHGARLVPDPGTGLSGAINVGFAAAGPETVYCTWIGDDDLLAPGSLSATTAALAARPDASMVYGWCDYIDEHGQVVFVSRAGWLAAAILRFGPNLVPQPGSLMRYADVLAVGGLDETVRLAMDLDLFLRLRKRGRLVALPRTLSSFRWHADSMTVGSENASAEESDRVRARQMRPMAARAYRVLRWPGRWALKLAKRRVEHNLRRRERRGDRWTWVPAARHRHR